MRWSLSLMLCHGDLTCEIQPEILERLSDNPNIASTYNNICLFYSVFLHRWDFCNGPNVRRSGEWILIPTVLSIVLHMMQGNLNSKLLQLYNRNIRMKIIFYQNRSVIKNNINIIVMLFFKWQLFNQKKKKNFPKFHPV